MKAWRLLGRLMAYRPWLYLANGLLWMVVHSAFIVPGLLAKAFFDALEGRPGALGSTGTVLVLVGAFAAARIGHIYLSAVVDILHRFTMSALVRVNAFEGILALPGAAPLACSSSEALDYLKEDAAQIEDAISWTLDVLGSACFTALSLVLLVRIDPVTTVLAFAPLVLVVAIAHLAETRVGRYREAARKASEEATGAIGETFGAIQAVKTAGAEERALARLRALCAARARAALRDRLFNQLLDSIYHNTVGLGTGILLLLVAARAGTGGFRLGDFSLFVFCLAFVSDYTCFWGSFLAHYRQTRVSLERLGKLTGDPSGRRLVEPTYLGVTGRRDPARAAASRARGRPRAPAAPAAHAVPAPSAAMPAGRGGRPLLELEDLSSLHPSGRGIRNVSLALAHGELVVVTGRIGSGKTTLLRAIQGLLPAEGRVLVEGRPVADRAATFVPPLSAYCPQVPVLFSDSLAGNIVLGLEEAEDALARALRAAVLEEDVATLPEGLATRIGPRGLKLSGGQAQRAAAARMFVRGPAIHFIDDMSSALDADTEELLWRRFLEGGGRTCLAVSHRRATLELADRVLLLVEGRIEAEGPLRRLLETSAEMRAIWGSHPAEETGGAPA